MAARPSGAFSSTAAARAAAAQQQGRVVCRAPSTSRRGGPCHTAARPSDAPSSNTGDHVIHLQGRAARQAPSPSRREGRRHTAARTSGALSSTSGGLCRRRPDPRLSGTPVAIPKLIGGTTPHSRKAKRRAFLHRRRPAPPPPSRKAEGRSRHHPQVGGTDTATQPHGQTACIPPPPLAAMSPPSRKAKRRARPHTVNNASHTSAPHGRLPAAVSTLSGTITLCQRRPPRRVPPRQPPPTVAPHPPPVPSVNSASHTRAPQQQSPLGTTPSAVGTLRQWRLPRQPPPTA
jgi:hypothetical protein